MTTPTTKPMLSLFDQRYTSPCCEMLRGVADRFPYDPDNGYSFSDRYAFYQAIVQHVKEFSRQTGKEDAAVYDLPIPEKYTNLVNSMIWIDPQTTTWVHNVLNVPNGYKKEIYDTITHDETYHPDIDPVYIDVPDETYGSWVRLRYVVDEFIEDAAGWNVLVRTLKGAAVAEAVRYEGVDGNLSQSTEWLRFRESEQVEGTDIYTMVDMDIRIFDPLLGCYPTLLLAALTSQVSHYEVNGAFLAYDPVLSEVYTASRILKWKECYEDVKLFITQNSTSPEALHEEFIKEFPTWQAWRDMWMRTPETAKDMYWDVEAIPYIQEVLNVESDYTHSFNPHHMLWLYWGINAVQYYYGWEVPKLLTLLETNCVFNPQLTHAYQHIFGKRVTVPYMCLNQFKEYVIEQGYLRWDISGVKDSIAKYPRCYNSEEYMFEATVEACETWFGQFELDMMIHRLQEMYNGYAGQKLTFTACWIDPSVGSSETHTMQRYVFVPSQSQGEFNQRLDAGFDDALDIIDPLSRKSIKQLLIEGISDQGYNKHVLPSLKVYVSADREMHPKAYCLEGFINAAK